MAKQFIISLLFFGTIAALAYFVLEQPDEDYFQKTIRMDIEEHIDYECVAECLDQNLAKPEPEIRYETGDTVIIATGFNKHMYECQQECKEAPDAR